MALDVDMLNVWYLQDKWLEMFSGILEVLAPCSVEMLRKVSNLFILNGVFLI